MSFPAGVATPKIWFDATDDATKLISDSQGNVTEWKSKGTLTGMKATPPSLTGSRTLNIGSNGGLTIAFRARLTNPGLNERIIEFANGAGDQTVLIYRTGVSNTFSITVINTTTTVVNAVPSAVGSLDTDFHNWIFRINGNTRSVQIYRDGGSPNATGTYGSDLADRTVSTVNIGRSIWAPNSDAYTEGDISALYVFDRYITDQEMAVINTHMGNYTATPLPIYNAKVSLNAALLTQSANTAVAAWEDFAQGTAGNRPTFQLNPPRINFSRASSQFLQTSAPVVKTGRLLQNGKNSVLFPQQSSLRTDTLALAGTSKRTVFAVARNLTEVNGGALATWSNVQFVRLERTTTVNSNNIINISEIEVYDAQGRRIPHTILTPTMSAVYNTAPSLYGPQFTTDNNISLGADAFPSTAGTAIGEYIQVNLGAERTISKVIIRNRYDGSQARILGTTLRLQRANNTTDVATIPITNASPQSLIFTPNGLFFGASGNQTVNLFTTTSNVTGAVIARYSGYRTLQMIPGNSGSTHNLDTYMVNDTEVNVLSLINDASIQNIVRVNGYPQTMTQNTNAQAYSATTSVYAINSLTEPNSVLQLCELLMYDNDATPTLTLANVQAIEKYLYDKWILQTTATAAGVSTSIPVPRVWFDATDADTVNANTQGSIVNLTSKGNTYAITASPTGSSQRECNIGTNGGFTAAFRVEFSGSGVATTYERIFDFSTLTPPQSVDGGNIIVGRQGTTNNLSFWLMNGGTRVLNEYQLPNAITSGANNFIIRVNNNTKTAQWYKNGNLEASTTYATSIADRVFTSCFIGRSNYINENATLNGNLRALYIFDRAITDDEMAVINSHMTAGTATQLPIYNPFVSLNAALINATAGSTLSAWEDFTSTNSPTFQPSPARVVFNGSGLASTGQFFTVSTPLVKTGRITQYGKNTIYMPPQSALITSALAFPSSTNSRSVFFVGRNLTEVLGSTSTTWSNVRYIRLQRTTGTDPLNINEIEVYDGTGKRIPVSTLTATQSSIFTSVASLYGPQFVIDNAISTVFDRGYSHTNAGGSEFIQVDLGSEKLVSKVILRNRYDEQKTRLVGTTLSVRRADNSQVASTAITISPDTLIYTPTGLVGAKYQQTELFTPSTSVTGALMAQYTDYRALSLTPFTQTTPNVDSGMISDLQVNVFSLINDATVGNSVRVNGTTQTSYYNQTNAYTTTAAQYIMNYTTAKPGSTLQMCEMLIYDTALTEQQVTDIQTYLIQKWHYSIGTIQADLTPFIAVNGGINYWWRFSDITKMSSVTLALTGGPGETTAVAPALNYNYTITGLTNDNRYTCTIRATGEDGQTNSSSYTYRPVEPGGIAQVPTNVNADYSNDGIITVTWEKPDNDGGSEIMWYVVRSTDTNVDSSEYKYFASIEGYKRRLQLFVGSPLPPNTFVIQAVSDAGYGVSQELAIETPLP